MKIYVLYHGNCPDGFGAAYAAYLKLPKMTEYIPVGYGKPPPAMEGNSIVYVLDFSYPRQVLLDLDARMYKVCVLDHHESAQNDLDGLKLSKPDSFIAFDMNESGATMAWRHFHSMTTPLFFQYLRDRDLWSFKLPDSREVSYAVRSYPYDFVTWHQRFEVTSSMYRQLEVVKGLVDEGKTLKRLIDTQVESMASAMRWAIFNLDERTIRFWPYDNKPNLGQNEHWIPVANASVLFSEVGERLLQMTGAPISAYYSDKPGEIRIWGLRGAPGADCIPIAKAFGGGGHKPAAGFQQKISA